MMMLEIRLIGCICVVLGTTSAIVGQAKQNDIVVCRAERSRVKYKITSAGRGLGKEPVLGLRVVLRETDFREEYLREVIGHIKQKYCHETEIGIVLFDDEATAKRARVVVEHLAAGRKSNEIRGFYSFVASTGKELLEFSTKRGNPTNEIVVDLSQGRPK